MGKQRYTDKEFLDAWNRLGSGRLVAVELQISERAVLQRRAFLQAKHNIQLPAFADQRFKIQPSENKIRSLVNITGTVIVFSDAHFQPGEPSVAFKALLRLIKKLKPKLVVANGDLLDGARIGRFGAEMGWRPTTSLKDEVDSVRWHMNEIFKASVEPDTLFHRTIGNHDIRFENRLANRVPEYKNIEGTRLKDHLPDWSESWSLLVNDNTMIKHRFQNSGIHSGHTNVVRAGISTVSGHTHLLQVSNWTDYTGRRYGVSTGMLADPSSQAFDYIEDNPFPWCSGFAILSYSEDGRLLPPELLEVIDGSAYFRGEEV